MAIPDGTPKYLENATGSSIKVDRRKFVFTQRKLESLSLPAGIQRVFYRDEATRGLFLAVSRSGGKVFYHYRKFRNVPERVKLGAYPDLSIDQARGMASANNSLIAQGVNPAEERRSVKDEMTINELYDTFILLYAKERLRPKTLKGYQSLFDCHLSEWKNRKLFSITPQDVNALHAKIGRESGQFSANRATELLCAMYARAKRQWGYQGPNPAADLEAFTEHSRERFLGDADATEPARFFKALSGESEFWQDFFKVSLLTGARCSNCEAMAWSEINWHRGEWVIPAASAKENEAIHVVLVEPVIEILKRRSENSQGGPWVFPSPRQSKSGHVSESKAAWARILAAAKIRNLRQHDLRRSLGSFLVATGASLAQVGKQLGHKDGSPATKIYSRLNLDGIRASVGLAAQALLSAGDESHLEDGK